MTKKNRGLMLICPRFIFLQKPVMTLSGRPLSC